jgi:PEP-CTERM motif-containing protein
MHSKLFSTLALLLAGAALSLAQDTTTVNWSNFSANAGTQSSILFRDAGGTPLSQGVAANNTDGMLVQLGYYSTASAANSFTGTWTPITGFTSASLPTQPARTSIGDAFNNNGGGGSGSGAGVIDFTTFFVSGDNQPFVYDPSFSGAYQTLSQISITNSAPPNGIILSIRFYDTTNGASGNFNAVSSDAWTWQSPNTPGGGQVNISIASLFVDGPGGSLADLEWQDATNPFKTTISAIPEPSTVALIVAGAVGFLALRRRTKS